MAHLELWRLATDVLLLGGLVWLAWQIGQSRSSSAAAESHGLELERTLRALIKEADLSSSSLTDQLIRRQQSLERLLRDIEAVEVRLERTRSGDAMTGPARAAESTLRPAPRAATMPQPPSFSAVATPTPVKSRKVETNIYGEPIGEVATAPAAPNIPAPRVRSPLAESIEKEIIPTPPVTPPIESAEAIAEVRRAAEELLRAGRDLEFVAQRTRLPLDEVRLLSQLIVGEIEQRSARSSVRTAPPPVEEAPTKPPTATSDDPRLGVLSPIRRSIETV